MDGVQEAINTYGKKIYKLSVDQLEQEFGKESFNATILNKAHNHLTLPRKAGLVIILKPIIWAAAESYHKIGSLQPAEQEHVQMITRTLYSDERTFKHHYHGISFELDKLLPFELRSKIYHQIIDQEGADIFRLSVGQVVEKFGLGAFKFNVLERAAEKLACTYVEDGYYLDLILYYTSISYNRLNDLTEEEADHVKLITLAYYSHPQVYPHHKICPEFEALLPV
jgi:hypothetical protein